MDKREGSSCEMLHPTLTGEGENGTRGANASPLNTALVTVKTGGVIKEN